MNTDTGGKPHETDMKTYQLWRQYEAILRGKAKAMLHTNPPLIIPLLGLTIAMRCSLKCRHCAAFSPYHDNPPPMDLDRTVLSLTAMSNAVDEINQLIVSGGEPLMQKQLPDLMAFILGLDKVREVILITNGTIVPNEALCAVLVREPRLRVLVNHYGDCSRKVDEVTATLSRHGLRFEILDKNRTEVWQDIGDKTKRHQSAETLRTYFDACGFQDCKSLRDGKFYGCSFSHYFAELGIHEPDDRDYVDLLHNSTEENRRQIRQIYELDYVAACDHCLPPWERAVIPAGEQLPKDG